MQPDDYACAVCARTLTGQSLDALGAAALASRHHRLGVALQRLRADPSRAGLSWCAAELERRARDAVRRRLVRRAGVDAGNAARTVLDWWLDPTCSACGGVRWRARDGRLTDHECSSCCGSGVRPLDGDVCQWVAAEIERAVSAADDAIRAA